MSAVKRRKLDPGGHAIDALSEENRAALASFGSLGVEMVATIFGYLSWDEILRARICRTFRKAATVTLVSFDPFAISLGASPESEYRVHSLRRFEALAGMSRALPGLQQLCFHPRITGEMRFEDGEDPEPELTPEPREDRPVHRIDVVANFTQLRILALDGMRLNGRYPSLFGFPYLQKLLIKNVGGLKVDLEEVVSALPPLRELHCVGVPLLRGSTASLRVLRETLNGVTISNCPGVHGDLADLADFPVLKRLVLDGRSISGDVRQIGERDFPVLRTLQIPASVYGSSQNPLARVRDAPELMTAVCRLKLRNCTLIDHRWTLAEDSIDRYPGNRLYLHEPPFSLEIVTCGQCVGWRWTNNRRACCETTWVDEEPETFSAEYADFWSDGEHSPFKNFVGPLTEANYQRLARP